MKYLNTAGLVFITLILALGAICAGLGYGTPREYLLLRNLALVMMCFAVPLMALLEATIANDVAHRAKRKTRDRYARYLGQ